MDITTLGIGLDSRQVDDGRRALDDFSKSAEKAEKAAEGVGKGAKKGASDVKSFEDQMTAASVKGALFADAIQKGVQIAIDAVKQLYALMSEAGDYADLADMTGASAVNIAKLQTAADVAGISMQSMAGHMSAMTRILKATDEEGDKAARALARINIKYEDFIKLDPAERVAALGVAMGKYADGVEKTEILQAVAGRGAAELGKAIKVLADETAFATRLNNEMIQSVDGLNDANAEFTSKSRQYIQAILVGTVPATEAFKLVIKETTASMFGMGDAADALGANQGANSFSEAVGHGLAGAITAFQLIYRVVESVINAVVSLIKVIIDLGTMDFSAAYKTVEDLGEKIKSIWSEDFAAISFGNTQGFKGSFQKKLDLMSKAAREAAAMAAGGEGSEEAKERIRQGQTDKEIADAKKKADELAKIAKKAAEDAIKLAQKQADDFDKIVGGGTAKAAGYNDDFIDSMKIINAESKKRNYTEEQYRTIVDSLLKQQPFYVQQLKEQAEAMEKYVELEQKMIDKAATDDAATLKASAEAATAAETELKNFGKLKSEIAETTLLRLKDTLEMVKADPVSRAFYQQQISDQQRVVNALKGTELLEAHKKLADEAKKEYDKAWEQVGQSFADQLMQGGRSASDYIKNLFRTMILRPTVMAAFSGGGSGGGAGGGGINMGNATSMYGMYNAYSSGMGLSGMAGGAGVGGAVGNIAAGYAGATGGGLALSGVGAAGPIMSTSGAAGAAFEGYMASTGIMAAEGGTLAGAAGAGAAGGAGAGASAALAAVPVAGWVALAAIAAYAAYKKWGKHKGGPKVEGSFGLDSGTLIGAYGNQMDTNAARAVSDLNSQYRRMATLLGSSNQNMQFGVGYSMDPAGTAPSMVHIRSEVSESVNREAGRTPEELAKALAEGSATVMVEALRNSGMEPQMLAYFDKITVGMTDQAKLGAFEQVAAVGQYWKAMQAMGGNMKELQGISLEAAVALAELSGGVEQLSSNMSSYIANYYSEAEQLSIGYQQLANQLNAAGSGWQGWSEEILRSYDKEWFRKQVEAIDLTTELGQRQYASMLAASDAFAKLDTAARSSTDSLAGLQAHVQAMGLKTSYLGKISEDAAKKLVLLAGGVDSLASGVATYQEKFYTDKERESLAYQQMAVQLNESGSGWTGFSEAILRSYTPARFREIVEGLNLEVEGDRQRYIALMKVAGAFAELKESTDGAIKAQERYDKAFDTLRDAYERHKSTLIETRDAMKSATQSFLDFNASLKVDETLTTLDPSARMWELQNQYGSARNKAEAGGYQAEDVSRMQEAARALLQGGRDYYGSGEGYTELFNQITKEMEGAAAETKIRQNYAEASLKNLELSVGYLVNIDNHLIDVYTALTQFLSARTDLYTLGYPHAEGLSRVPFNNYPALLHKDELVLPAQESNFVRGLPDFSGELRALRQEVASLRKENRQDAGNTIGATFTAAAQAAQVQSEATIRAARQRVYQSRSRPVLA